MGALKDLKLLIEVQTKNEQKLDRLTGKLKKLKSEQANLNGSTKGYTAEQKEQIKAMKQAIAQEINGYKTRISGIKKELKLNKQKINQYKQHIKQMRRFKGEYLSLMFFGMAITRTFGGLLKASWKTFSSITEGTDMANNAFNRMNAAWEYFKFSFFEVLMSTGLFNNIVDFVLRLVEWWGNLNQKTKETITTWTMLITIIGGIFTALGILKLGFGGIITIILDLIGYTDYLTVTAEGTSAAFMAWSKIKFFGLIGGLIVVIGWIITLKNKVGGWGEFFKAVLRGLVRVFFQFMAFLNTALLDGIVFMEEKLRGLLEFLLKIARVFDTFFGTNYSRLIQADIKGLDILIQKTKALSAEKKFDIIHKGEQFITNYLPLKNVPEGQLGQQTNEKKGNITITQNNNIVIKGVDPAEVDRVAQETTTSFNEAMRRAGYGSYLGG